MIKTITGEPINGSVTAPSSKSYAQRAIVAAMLASGKTILSGITLCDDTQSVLNIAQTLGCDVKWFEKHLLITSPGVSKFRATTLDMGESGLATRLFTPIAALGTKPVTITGQGSLLKRPNPILEQTLRELGAKITTNDGFLPFTVQGPMTGGNLTFNSSSGSQFLSGLLMSLPTLSGNTTLNIEDLKSKPYINMTIDVMHAFGIEVHHSNYETFIVRGNQHYEPTFYIVEGDWSAASCLLVAGAVGGSITISNLNLVSLQPDRQILKVIAQAGALVETDSQVCTVSSTGTLSAFAFDATDCPDLFPALVALAANCTGISVIHGTSRLTHKESNRAEALKDVFSKMGIEVDISEPNVMRVMGSKVRSAEVKSYGDHRIAMAAAVAVSGSGCKISISDAGAVAKSYPKFWEDLTKLQNP